jgi:uncharacterized coiled-coil DUF342 family protein
LYRQIARVSRRLFLQTLLDSLAWCWAGAVLLATIWFLVEPFVPGDRPEWSRWAVAGSLGGLATLLAVVLALIRAPSRLAAALLLDERFGLKERVTTSLTLAPEHVPLPAAQALLADVGERVVSLDIRSRFPVALRWHALLVPLGGLLLAVVAVFYEPSRTQATPLPEDLALAPANRSEIEQKVKELEKKAREKRELNKATGEKADPLDEELKKLLNRPRDTQEEVRNRIKDLTALEEKIKNRQDALAEKAQAIKDQLRQMNQMSGMDTKNGPAKDLQKAVDKGDFNKAQEEVERLAKKLKNNELTEQDREQLKKQLQDLQEKLKRLSDPKEQEEKLQELRRQGKIDQDQLDRALDQLRKNSQRLNRDDQERLQEIADALRECERCMKRGDSDKAAEALKKAGQCMRKMDDLENMQEMQEQLEQLEGCKRSMCQGVDGNPVPAQGRRPEGDPHETGSFTSRVKGDFDPKGQKELTGYAPGTSFKKKSAAEIAGEIKEASQEAPEALERQRIPRAAADMAKGYYENLRKIGEEEKKDQ